MTNLIAFAVGGMTAASLGMCWSLLRRPKRPARRLERLILSAARCDCGCGSRAVMLGSDSWSFCFESRAEVDALVADLAAARDDLWPEPARIIPERR